MMSFFYMTINLGILAFFSMAIPYVSAKDPLFESCVPQNCGKSPNISYPFYLKDRQPSHCGRPGFKLKCNIYNLSVLYTSPTAYYIVDDIFYNNRSLRMHLSKRILNEAGFDHVYRNNSNNATCSPPGPTFNFTLSGTQFSISPNHTNLYFLSYCSPAIQRNLTSYKLNCSADYNSGTEMVHVMFEKDPNFSYASKGCANLLATPVEITGNGSRVSMEMYKKALTRGFSINWSPDYNCSACEKSGGHCGFDEDLFRFNCFCQDGPQTLICLPSRSSRMVMDIAIVASLAGIGFVAIIVCCCFRRNIILIGKEMLRKNKNIEAFLGEEMPGVKIYSYSNIKRMTNSFKEKLGEGSYGDVYKGTLKDGRLVAVKLLKSSKCDGEEFINKVASISGTSHVNVVSLLGICFDGSARALIYEFIPNGSLEKFMYNDQSTMSCHLEWDILYQICVGIARGLEYLHYGCNTPILHIDIKPHNILLDEEFCPKISDFGLDRLATRKESRVTTQGTRGTEGYIAPETFDKNLGGLSYKSDVYSYGMMVLEMVGGRINKDDGVKLSSVKCFPEWMYNQLAVSNDTGLNGVASDEENLKARKMVLVGLWCTQNDPSSRPTISQVVDMLQGNIESLQVPPKSFSTLPPKSLDSSSL